MFDKIAAENTSLDEITSNLNLINTGENGTEITWQSSNPDVLQEDGTIIPTEEDVIVTLTAIIIKGEENSTKEFVVLFLTSAQMEL